MVIVNPKLSLPSDLPYKKRQRPFNPNTTLQQATIRYNEALRKQYNDIQFERKFENGNISQNELTSVNTVDVGKGVDSQLFHEMCDLNPLQPDSKSVQTPSTRKRKSKKFFICSGSSISDAITAANSSFDTPNNIHNHNPQCINNSPNNVLILPPKPDTQNNAMIPNCGTTYDCNNTEMFPQLSATIPNAGNENVKPHFSRCANNSNRQQQQQQQQLPPPSSNSSLEAQAINEYEPTADSAHDMIFGNVMGIHYGSYIHDQLWTPVPPHPNQQHHHLQNQQHLPSNVPLQNSGHVNNTSTCQCPMQFNIQPQNYHNNHDYQPIGMGPPPPHNHHPQINICGASKSLGFNLPPPPCGSGLGVNCQNPQNTFMNMSYDSGGGAGIVHPNASFSTTSMNPLAMGGNHNLYNHHTQFASRARSGSRPRSTSVPRPRIGGGARKETLKQAAIRCGIIKGNQTVPVIPKRSHCLIPLQLAQAQSDPAVTVVEILHPRALIPTCSSEVLMEENNGNFKSRMDFNQPHGEDYGPNRNTNGNTETDLLSSVCATPKENISEEGRLLTQISSISDFRILEGAMSCASF